MESLETSSGAVGLDASRMFPATSSFKVLKTGGFWSRSDYIVNTQEGRRFMKADHKSCSSKREIIDESGSLLFRMRMDKLKFPMVYYLEGADGSRVAELKGKWSLLKLNADLHMTNVDGQPIILELRSQDNANEVFNIAHKGRIIAHMARHDYNRKLDKERGISQWYDVNVAANVDAAFICAVTIALDDANTVNRQVSMANPASMAAVGVTAAIAGRRDAKNHPEP